MSEKFDALIVDPDVDTRMLLKQATTAVPTFGRVTPVGQMHDARQKIESTHCDVVFISYKLGQDDLTNFIKECKASRNSQDAAFVAVLKTKNQETSTITQNILVGVDGFLFEPYSVDSLVEITALAAKVRKERARAREEAAIKFLLNELINRVDLLASLKASGAESRIAWKEFREKCNVLRALAPASLELYYELAVSEFDAAPIPKKTYQRRSYSGASTRVKKKLDDKLLEQLMQVAEGTDEPTEK